MGNLGLYEDFAIKAKEAGGVEKWIENIERAAAAKAMPKGFAAGAAVAAAAAWGVAAAIKGVSKRAEAREAEANEAKARLTELGDLSTPDDANSGDSAPEDGDGLADLADPETPS